MLENSPLPACILDRHYHTILANEAATQLRSQLVGEQGSPLGDFFGCIYATLEEGSGHVHFCAYCGMSKLLSKDFSGSRLEGECLITNEYGDKMELKIWARPFSSQGEEFITLTLEDQGQEKRRLKMERIFFHDVLNTAAGVQWSASFLEDEITETDRRLMQRTLAELSERLVDEINSQRDYVLAERGEYSIRKENISVLEYLTKWAHVHRQQIEQVSSKLDIHVTPPNMKISTDANLLRRILINLLKNATEACIPGETIHLSAVQDRSGKITFTVKNAAVMAERVSQRILRHQISTKGQRRGYGVESARLLSEQYLGGKFSFVSKDGIGTIFKVVLPQEAATRHAAA